MTLTKPLSLFILLLSIQFQSFGQREALKEKIQGKYDPYEVVQRIETNFLMSTLIRDYNISYERSINRRSSVFAQIVSKNDAKDFFPSESFEISQMLNLEFGEINFRGWEFGTAYRYYPKSNRSGPEGFFLHGGLLYRSQSTEDDHFSYNSGSGSSVNSNPYGIELSGLAFKTGIGTRYKYYEELLDLIGIRLEAGFAIYYERFIFQNLNISKDFPVEYDSFKKSELNRFTIAVTLGFKF